MTFREPPIYPAIYPLPYTLPCVPDCMYTTLIEAFAINILKGTNILLENTVFPEVDLCSLYREDLYLFQEFLPFKEFTLAFVWAHLSPEVSRKASSEWRGDLSE